MYAYVYLPRALRFIHEFYLVDFSGERLTHTNQPCLRSRETRLTGTQVFTAQVPITV